MGLAGFDALLRRARRRDPAALDSLVQMYSQRVYGLLYRLTGSRETAEDLLQETFLRVVRTIEGYEHDGRFEAWLFRIAANLARDHARRARRWGNSGGPAARYGEGFEGKLAETPSPVAEPRQCLSAAEDAERLQACLARLPETDREILLLRHFADLPFREIAEMLGIPVGTALARAHRALARLRREFEAPAPPAAQSPRHAWRKMDDGHSGRQNCPSGAQRDGQRGGA